MKLQLPAPTISSKNTSSRRFHLTPDEHLDAARKQLAVEASKRAMRYGDEFMKLRASSDMLRLKIFPDLKEVSESFAMFRAVADRVGHALLGDPRVLLVAVGDGCSPRTGATFAFRSRWHCVSVDPNLKGHWPVERLFCVPKRVEEWSIDAEGNRAIIVAVHSHANITDSIRAIKNHSRLDVFTNPCCKDLDIPERIADETFEDYGILSPARTIKVWKDVRLP